MQNVTIKKVQKLVKENNASGKITLDYKYNNQKDEYYVYFSNGVKLLFETPKEQNKVFRILKLELGFEQNFNFSSDEHDGIVQAAQNGENPFAFSVICTNTCLNGIFN